MCRLSFRVLLFATSLTSSVGLGGVAVHADEPPKLLGQCTVDQLMQEPFDAWFGPGYADYSPHPEILEALRDVAADSLEVEIFFGTWCGDSRREVPRLIKLLDTLELPPGAVRLVAVDNVEGVHKRSPDGEERGLEIYRVPTVVVRRDGVEVSRIVEYPALSLERDLLAIVSGTAYQPSYASYPALRQWLRAGLLSDPNVRADGLADRVRASVRSESEIAAAARVLLDRGDVSEAIKLYHLNRALYPRGAQRHAQLAEALLAAGNRDEAKELARRALVWSEDTEASASLVRSFEQSRSTQ